MSGPSGMRWQQSLPFGPTIVAMLYGVAALLSWVGHVATINKLGMLTWASVKYCNLGRVCIGGDYLNMSAVALALAWSVAITVAVANWPGLRWRQVWWCAACFALHAVLLVPLSVAVSGLLHEALFLGEQVRMAAVSVAAAVWFFVLPILPAAVGMKLVDVPTRFPWIRYIAGAGLGWSITAAVLALLFVIWVNVDIVIGEPVASGNCHVRTDGRSAVDC